MSQVTRLGRFPGFTRLLLAVGSAGAVSSVVSIAAVPTAAAVPAVPSFAPPPVRGEDRAPVGDHLIVTVRNAGASADGTFQVDCHPSRGTHPDASGACAAVDRSTRWGRDVFAPAPKDGFCTMQYGGPATAHVTGTWAGRPVDATFDRGDGCQIERWDRLVPLLPEVGS
ncbi:SSI family serine proteinase inhibitor [Streptomyces sp. NPDC003011]